MSAQAGVFYFDGRPVDRSRVDVLDHTLEPYGPDRAGRFVQPGLAVVHHALQITPEDTRERQPLVSSRGNVMTWDGRLDNRDDLRAELFHEAERDDTDVALAMAVYEKWGADGFAKLIGDWSLVVWDAERQAVVMASDYMGVRPLHYLVRPDSVSWSTAIEGLVHLHGLYDDLDTYYIVRMVASTRTSMRTPYRDVLAVPAGASLTFTRSRSVQESRFAGLRPFEVRYRDPKDCEAHLRTVFVESVRNRLRSTRPVWAQLSGGLDSSAVVCAADMLVRQGRAVAPDLCTLSFVTNSAPDADERRFMAAVEQHRGRAGHHILEDPLHTLVYPSRGWITPVQPPYGVMQSYHAIRDLGGRLLLTGTAGDEIMANYVHYHFDVAALLQRAKPLAALGLARLRAHAAKRSIWEIVGGASMELLPGPLLRRRTLRNALTSSGVASPATDAAIAQAFLIKPEYARWWRDDRERCVNQALTFPLLSQRRLAVELTSMVWHRHLQSLTDVPLAHQSHPFADRRVVELMLGIPSHISAPPGEPRGLMRRAFAPFMPPRIINRFSKGTASPVPFNNNREVLQQWLNQPEAVKVLGLECLDRGLVLKYLQDARDGKTDRLRFVKLLKIERWLNAREERRRQMSPDAPWELDRALDRTHGPVPASHAS